MYDKIFSKRPQALLLAAALVAGAGGIGFAAADRLHAALALNVASDSEAPSHSSGFAPVVKKALPSVVNISSSKVSKIPTNFSGGDDDQMPDDPLFRQFFGREFGRGNGGGRGFNMPREQREKALGSGVIMTADGYILTNNHVVDGATDVRVTLGDKREFKAKVVGTDPKTDIAVLKIDASALPAITVANSSKVEVGDYALAIGDPFGVGQTVTMGIVSATGRSHMGIEEYEDFIQTDAPINPGNSGGALVNDRGQLIGINTAIIAHGSEGNQGIGFAIPANMARSVMEQIVKNGKVTRAYLGVVPQDVTPAIAHAFNLKDQRGALVGDVSADGPAKKAGLQKGDVILSVNGTAVANSNDLRMTISMMAPDSSVNLKVLRAGVEKDYSVRLGELPTTEAAVQRKSDGSERSSLSGVSVQDLDARSSRQLGLPADAQGVVVTNVSPSSAAAEAGLQRGDVIQEVNRKSVRNTSEFERAMSGSKDETLLLVNRHGNTMYLAV
jgi:serine protease Do